MRFHSPIRLPWPSSSALLLLLLLTALLRPFSDLQLQDWTWGKKSRFKIKQICKMCYGKLSRISARSKSFDKQNACSSLFTVRCVFALRGLTNFFPFLFFFRSVKKPIFAVGGFHPLLSRIRRFHKFTRYLISLKWEIFVARSKAKRSISFFLAESPLTYFGLANDTELKRCHLFPTTM